MRLTELRKRKKDREVDKSIIRESNKVSSLNLHETSATNNTIAPLGGQTQGRTRSGVEVFPNELAGAPGKSSLLLCDPGEPNREYPLKHLQLGILSH